MSSPFANPAAWDRLVLQGPGGKVTLTAPRITATGEVLEQTAPERGVSVLGYAPREVTIEATLWDEKQWPEVQRLMDLWRPAGARAPKPLTAVHPQLELMRLERVYLWRVELLPYNPRDGYQLRLVLREWWPQAQKSPAKGTALGGGAGGVIDLDGIKVR